MAVDEAILRSCARGNGAYAAFYQWDPACLSLGYFQDVKREVNLRSPPVSGSRPGKKGDRAGKQCFTTMETTYSVIVPEKILPGSVPRPTAVFPKRWWRVFASWAFRHPSCAGTRSYVQRS